MADAAKVKRFRLHVVKELYETEKDYTRNLTFTVTHLLEKARQKGKHDNSFTEEVIRTLFCNIQDILSLHRRLLADLEACMPTGPTYEATIAQCYLKFQAEFKLYRVYGENNEHSQKLLYELEDHPAFKAFFVAAMVLGGKGDDSISAYLFKPIQRICKYPLLFRELEKYTPEDHPDRTSTVEVLSVMRDVCSVINEAKRRVESLEAIADWQATVEGWEGTNVTDTCNELVKEGSLIKISAGNTQERMFFLFDNLFVYCKKALLSRQKTLLFRGRISVESLDIENIKDGTADFHTNGIAVANGWKVHNIAKNKWFVLIARTPQEKLEWMGAIRREKEKRKRVAAGIARDTRNLILDKGDKLYQHAKGGQQLIRDHKPRLRTYTKCFTGEAMVTWLMENKEVDNVEEAMILGQALLENGIIHHVQDKHQFKRSELLYRFRYDDGTFRAKFESTELVARGVQVYCRLHGLFDPLIKGQRVGLRAMQGVVSAQRLIDWLQLEGDITRREEGVALGQELFATGILRHATDEHNFQDSTYFYRFTADDSHEGPQDRERKPSQVQRVEFSSSHVLSCLTLTIPFSETDGYGIELSDVGPVTVKSASDHAKLFGVCVGQRVEVVGGNHVDENYPHSELMRLLAPSDDTPPPLTLTVLKNSSEYYTLVPAGSGLGFHIKGSSPVVIHGVNRGSAASQVGLLPGCCILKIGKEDVLRASHDEVVSAIRKSLASTSKEEGGAKVNLKVSFSHLELVVSYHYDSSEDSPVKVFERTQESPYVYQVPAQLLALYAQEAEERVKRLVQSGVKEAKVTEYCTKLSAMATSYKKTAAILATPRWPSYKPHGTTHTTALHPCPSNLHTIVTEVASASTFPPTPSSPNDNTGPQECETYTSYFISTMAVPSISNKNFSWDDQSSLGLGQSRRELLHQLHSRVAELEADLDIVRRLVEEVKNPPDRGPLGLMDSLDSSSLLMVSRINRAEFSSIPSPSNSPLFRRGPGGRLLSVGSPEPVVKLVADSLHSKVSSLLEFLKDRLLQSVMEEADHLLTTNTRGLLAKSADKLKALSEDIRRCTRSKNTEEALNKAATSLVVAAKKCAQDLSLHVEVSLALCDNVDLLKPRDKLFAQALTALVTAFAHHLLAAARGRLNNAVEYTPSNRKASLQWLQLVANKGVLLHLQSTLLVQQDPELSALKDLQFVANQLRTVELLVREGSGSAPGSELPAVSVEGSYSEVRVTFDLPPSLYWELPEALLSSGVKVLPILFNKGLMDLEEGSDAYCWERDLNSSSLLALKTYYRSLRTFYLNESHLPEESDAKALAIHQLSQPLNAMGVLMQQVEVAVKKPTRPGIGLLSIAAELTTRMGALRVNVCNSGVFRAGMEATLEQTMVLARCHGLPVRSFRTALNTLRRKGAFSYIARKNNANVAEAFPKQPPKLYQLPPEV